MTDTRRLIDGGTDASVPDFGYCKHCGRVIVWDDYGYTHLNRWATCRDPADVSQLGHQHCELDLDNPVDPQPKNIAEASHLPLREPSRSLVK